MSIAYLGLGSNLGNKKKQIQTAIDTLDGQLKITVQKTATLLNTKPVGNTKQADFVNTIIKIETSLSPHQLLNVCLDLEQSLGRVRKKKWGPRKIDIDILFFGNMIINEKNLTIPHPELHKRKFVLESMLELDESFYHPVLKKNIKALYNALK